MAGSVAARLESLGIELPPPFQPVATYDGTEIVQKALSCVYRTGQRFGAGHVINVLRGSADDRISRLGHDRLSTYGIGKDLSQNEWRSVFRQLAAARLLIVDEAHGGLRLGPDCRAVLRGERRVALRQDPAQSRKAERRRREPDAAEALDPDAERLFEALRVRRAELAKSQSVPPYVIFHDTTLREVARRRPQSRQALAAIPGIGAAKLDRYADDLLALVRAHASAV